MLCGNRSNSKVVPLFNFQNHKAKDNIGYKYVQNNCYKAIEETMLGQAIPFNYLIL